MNLNNSPTWRVIEKKLKEDRRDLVEQLIKSADQRETDILRGRIQQLDNIIEAYPHTISNQSDTDT